MIDEFENVEADYEKLGLSFYLYWYLWRQLPRSWFFICTKEKNIKNKNSRNHYELATYFTELVNQVRFLMSVKY